jgi:energy-coupling factor transporter ATP-binding protein EcfA2
MAAPELVWLELYPPHDLDLAAVTAMLRPLANRPRLGMLRRTPVVVFECWSDAGTLRWLLGVEPMLAAQIPAQFRAQMPRLGIVRRAPARPVVTVAVDLRLQGLANPLRLDVAPAVSAGVLRTLGELHKGEHAVLSWVIGPAQQRRQRPQPLTVRQALGIDPMPDETAQDRQFWKNKTAEPLFGVRGRIGVTGSSRRTTAILRSLVSALGIANGSHAELRASQPSARNARRLNQVFQPGITWGCVVNAAELATLLGWPLAMVDVPGVLGKHIAPVPEKLLLPSDTTRTDRILGVSLHPADDGKLVRIPVQTSKHHVHIIGPTGSGKSTLLTELARADMAAGRALFVMEPRGDLVNDILSIVPEHRRNDVVVIEPGATYSIGINPLRGPRGEAERRADQIVHLFEAWFGSSIGPRSRDILLHCLIALARLSDGTLADLPNVLTNAQFRRGVLAKVNDPLVLAPFFAWFDATSEAEKSQAVAPVLNKARSILSPSASRRLLGQAEPKFDLQDLFLKRRIALVNLNAGVLGPDNASFIGAILLTELWAAIQRRATIAAEKRHPTMLIVDEVQNYLKLPIDFGDLLAQSRGLGAAWTLAHQHLDQLNASLQASILTNARSRVVFRPLKDLKPLAAALGGGLTGDDLEQLRAFEACARLLVDGTPSQPFSVRTRAIGPSLSNPDELRKASQARYGVDGSQLDARLAKRWQSGMSSQPDGPIGVVRRRYEP